MGINNRMGNSSPKLPPAPAAGSAAHNAANVATLILCSPACSAVNRRRSGHRRASPAGVPDQILSPGTRLARITFSQGAGRRVGPPHLQAAMRPHSPARAGFLFDSMALRVPGLKAMLYAAFPLPGIPKEYLDR